MKVKFKQAYINTAYEFSKLSYAVRLKVGCVVVKHGKIISIGYNGTPAGEDNCCEDTEGNTKPSVSHAEENALMKLAASNESSKSAVLFVTHAPCINCAKLIANAKIKKVYYVETYRTTAGLDYLTALNIKVEKLEKE